MTRCDTRTGSHGRDGVRTGAPRPRRAAPSGRGFTAWETPSRPGNYVAPGFNQIWTLWCCPTIGGLPPETCAFVLFSAVCAFGARTSRSPVSDAISMASTESARGRSLQYRCDHRQNGCAATDRSCQRRRHCGSEMHACPRHKCEQHHRRSS